MGIPIHSLPPQNSPDGADVFPTDDVSDSNTTKKLSLTRLKEWLQSLTSWITTAMIANTAVTNQKVDSTSFPLTQAAANNGEVGITVGNYKAVTLALQGGVKYLIICSSMWIVSGSGGNKQLQLRVATTVIDARRVASNEQQPFDARGIYTPPTTGNYTIDLAVSNVVGTATGTIGNTQYFAIPLIN